MTDTFASTLDRIDAHARESCTMLSLPPVYTIAVQHGSGIASLRCIGRPLMSARDLRARLDIGDHGSAAVHAVQHATATPAIFLVKCGPHTIAAGSADALSVVILADKSGTGIASFVGTIDLIGPGVERVDDVGTPVAEQTIEQAAEALALAYHLDGECMQRVVRRAWDIWCERYRTVGPGPGEPDSTMVTRWPVFMPVRHKAE